MTGYDVEFAPYLPVWSLWSAAAFAALLFSWLLWRAIPGSLLRAALAGFLLLALANPSLLKEQREENPDVALLIVDETPSQETAGRLEETRMLGEELRSQLAALDPQSLEIRTVTVRHEGLSDSAEGTRLAAAANAIADVPADRYAGAIVLTDGQVHDPDALLEALPEGPLHALLIGDPDASDRRLNVVTAPTFGVVGEELSITLRVEDELAPEDETVRPTVLLNGTPVRVPRIALNEDVRIQLSLERRGPSVVEVSIPAAPDELSEINNAAILTINGVRDRLRVLLISGEPHPGERTWRNLLKSDPSVDLVHFTILRPPEKQDGTPINELSLIAFPTRELFEERLYDFDLVVFDSYRRRGVLPLAYLANIVDYVREGGALLDAAGPGFAGPFSIYRSALGEILPGEPTGNIVTEPFKPQVTDLGLRHPVTANLPGGPNAQDPASEPEWGAWLRQIDTRTQGGSTLLDGAAGRPLLMVDRIGEGRVAQVTSDHIWLWARGFDGGGPQAELLRRLSHWLMKEPELEEETLSAEADETGLTIRLRSMEERNQAEVTVQGPSGQESQLTLSEIAPGQYEGRFPVRDSGLYEVSDGQRTARAAAGILNALEFSGLVPNDGPLLNPVESTGGRLAWISQDGMPALRRVDADRPKGGGDWIGLVRNNDYTVVGLSATPLLPGWLALLAAISLLAGAWRRETR